MIRNIVFDVGKVLMSYNPDAMMQKLGYQEETITAVNHAMFQNQLWNAFDRGCVSDQELLQTFISHNPTYEKQITEAFMTIPSAMHPYPYVQEWLSNLKQEGYRLYILSNYARKTFAETEQKMSFLPLMDGYVFSYQCGYIKPEAAIYQHLLEKYQLDPQECVFLDDRQENIDAAKKLGFAGILFESYDQAKVALETGYLANDKTV